MGLEPGTNNSTDPEGLIKQPYISRNPSGGFLSANVEPASAQMPAMVHFKVFDEKGELLHGVVRSR